MDGDHTARALARIDTALESLERMMKRVASSDPKAEQRYRELRSHVGDAMARLDRLIRELSR